MSHSVNTPQKVLKLPDLIEYYEVCNRAEGKSPKTISWYSANLRRFHNYLRSRHLPTSVEDIDTKLLREYVLHLRRQNRFTDHPTTPEQQTLLSDASIHGHVRTLRAFFGWLTTEGMLEANVAGRLKPPKVVRKVVTTLADAEIAAVFSTLNSTSASDIRNQTILMLLLDTGLRLGELIGLEIENVNMNEGLLKVLGKGKKERVVPFGSNAQRSLQRYIFRFRPEPIHPGIGNVFLSSHGAPLSGNSIKLMFSRLARRSGVLRLHAHLCRHTFATRFLINGGDVFTLQQILGHTTLAMVSHYVNLASSHIVIQHQKFSPMDRLKLHGR